MDERLRFLKLEAMKQIRGDCSSVGKTGYDVPNIGTTNWSELVELIESAHSFVSVLYNSVLMRSIAGVVAKLTMRVENARSMNRGWYGT